MKRAKVYTPPPGLAARPAKKPGNMRETIGGLGRWIIGVCIAGIIQAPISYFINLRLDSVNKAGKAPYPQHGGAAVSGHVSAAGIQWITAGICAIAALIYIFWPSLSSVWGRIKFEFNKPRELDEQANSVAHVAHVPNTPPSSATQRAKSVTPPPQPAQAPPKRNLPAAMRIADISSRMMAGMSLSWTIRQYLDARESQHPDTIKHEMMNRPSSKWVGNIAPSYFFGPSGDAGAYNRETLERYMEQYHDLAREACTCSPGDPGYDPKVKALFAGSPENVDDIWNICRHLKAVHG